MRAGRVVPRVRETHHLTMVFYFSFNEDREVLSQGHHFQLCTDI